MRVSIYIYRSHVLEREHNLRISVIDSTRSFTIKIISIYFETGELFVLPYRNAKPTALRSWRTERLVYEYVWVWRFCQKVWKWIRFVRFVLNSCKTVVCWGGSKLKSGKVLIEFFFVVVVMCTTLSCRSVFGFWTIKRRNVLCPLLSTYVLHFILDEYYSNRNIKLWVNYLMATKIHWRHK